MSLLSLFSQASSDTYMRYDVANTTSEAVVAFLVVFALVLVATTYIIVSILLARIFKKAGEAGWKAWVPVYNTWITLELGNQKGWWALVLLLPFVGLIGAVFLYIAMYHIGLKLDKEGVFVLWAIFFPIVWYIWLAMDNSTWDESASPRSQQTLADNAHPTDSSM